MEVLSEIFQKVVVEKGLYTILHTKALKCILSTIDHESRLCLAPPRKKGGKYFSLETIFSIKAKLEMAKKSTFKFEICLTHLIWKHFCH